MTDLAYLNIQSMIVTMRGVQVMLDRDLAVIYRVETKVLNQAVKRNMERFPQEFRFQLTQSEDHELVAKWEQLHLRSQAVTSSRHGGRRYLPIAFTEQGVAMLSAVLHSDTAVKVSIKIINAFFEMRRFIQNNAQVFARLDSVEQRQLVFESETEKKFEKVF
ncbi:MAG: ORF6N domain-containing protein [Pelodictyon phaeoclathratiforme]